MPIPIDRKRIVLHIGLHKTGSTSIQRWALDNADTLNKNSVLYPSSGTNVDGNHSALAWSLSRSRGTPINLFHSVLDEIQKTECQTIFISGEEFESIKRSTIEELSIALKDYDVEIHAYIRPQQDIIRSQYPEWIKNFLTNQDFSVFWRFHTQLHEYDYLRLYLDWSDFFDRDRIFFHPYKNIASSPNGILEHLFGILNLQDAKATASEIQNVSPPEEVVRVWRYMLNKISIISGRNFDVYNFWKWEEDINSIEQVRSDFSRLMAQATQLYMESGGTRTKFQGYSTGEEQELVNIFLDRNAQLFDKLGYSLWTLGEVQPEGYAGVSQPLSSDFVASLDNLFSSYLAELRAGSKTSR